MMGEVVCGLKLNEVKLNGVCVFDVERDDVIFLGDDHCN
jgi:hypothetical protein